MKTVPTIVSNTPPRTQLRLALALLGTLAASVSVSAQTGGATTSSTSDAAQRMNPFTVSQERDSGFQSAVMGTGSRLALELKDAAVPYTVINREFIEALGITDLREAASWAVGNTFYNSDNGSDSRGLSSQYFSRGNLTSQGGMNGFGNQRNFYQNSSISGDSYAVETFDFGRGPNAPLFGQGAGTGGDAGNGGLAGVSSVQTKRARFDGARTTISAELGQWDYRRFSVDHNQPITDKFSIRLNAVDFDKRAWRHLDMQTNRGLSFAATYQITPRTEFRLDASNEKRESHVVGSGWDEFLSGWDGRTTFRGPITNAMLSTNATPGTTTVTNASYGTIRVFGAPAGGLTFNGEPQGVDRLGQQLHYNAYEGTVMNYQNFPFTRRADSTTRVPLWSRTSPNGNYFMRAEMTQGNGSAWPSFGVGRAFHAKHNLPGDMFHRATENSRFRKPSERWEGSLDVPTIVQSSKDIQFALSHRFGEKLFVEIGGDTNRNYNTNRNIDDPNPGGRSAYIDLSQIRPDGSLNPGFLDVYTSIPFPLRLDTTSDSTFRANAAFVQDLGRWGNYTFNIQGSATKRDNKDRRYVLSMLRNADSRLWNAGADQIRTRVTWSDTVRSYTEPVNGRTVQFTDVDWTDPLNPVIMPTVQRQPGWVLNSWSNSQNNQQYAQLQATARYFSNKVIFNGSIRRDHNVGSQQASLARAGDLPVGWNGQAIFRPNAPADYYQLTYIPLNSAGLPINNKPLVAQNRPTTVVNGLTVRDARYDGTRFRNDYNNPDSDQYRSNKSYGAVWHMTPWLSPLANWSDTYTPSGTNSFDLTGEVRRPVAAEGYDVGATLSLFNRKVTLKYDYFSNTRINNNNDPAALDQIDNLYNANRFDDADSTASGRNALGIAALPGTDYADRKNWGWEWDLAFNLITGFRLTANGQFSSFTENNAGQLTKKYILDNSDVFLTLLQQAGGMLDTSAVMPQNARFAPGLALPNPAVTAAVAADKQLAVDSYNNIWREYTTMLDQSFQRFQNRDTFNIFADYTFQAGKVRGLRVGAGIQWQGPALFGNRGGETYLDPNNSTIALDDPSLNNRDFAYGGVAYNTRANASYTFRLSNNRTLGFTLQVANPINTRRREIGDAGTGLGRGFGATSRQPNGDLTKPDRRVTGELVARFNEPINVRLMSTYTFGYASRR